MADSVSSPIYPHLDDRQLQKKITLKKEFRFKYDGTIENVREKSNKLCKKAGVFELSPHQEFVKRFISYDNPYNGILLFHGLGSGKTCSAIGITETLRKYSKYIPNFKKILIVASPNVQENFKLQLFDPNKLVKKNGLWDLAGCVGSALIEELSRYQIDSLSKDEVGERIKKVIKDNYSFIGYIKLANFIQACISSKDKRKLQSAFEGRVVVIDEIHNIRIQGDTDSNKKKVATSLHTLVQRVKGTKFVFLTGTPMYNDPKEIVFILNLLNMNDDRPPIKISSVFNKKGELLEDGLEMLKTHANGYVSYVRGENPYTFPYLTTPKMYNDPASIVLNTYPEEQFNGKRIDVPIRYLDIYINRLSPTQEDAYNRMIERITEGMSEDKLEAFEEMDSFRYTEMMKPIQTLNLCYPTSEGEIFTSEEGLKYALNYKEVRNPPSRNQFEYKKNELNGMFQYDRIGEYSSKIKSILDHILDSKGIVLIYSQYIDCGLIPMALALEELGFKRYGAERKTLFKEKKKGLNLNNMRGDNPDSKFIQASYAIISGEKTVSPDNNEEIEALTNGNSNGERVKVVLISQAGTEGIDLKNLRQVHIMEPWYNLNRIEQIIGRARRNCSHSELPIEQRNFQLFLHATMLSDETVEAVDMFLYRNAELKSIKIGKVTRALKEAAVDCLLNQAQQIFSSMDEVLNIELSNGEKIDYPVKDQPFTSLCDYMDTCNYQCINKIEGATIIDSGTFRYKDTWNDKIINKVKELFFKRHVYKRDDMTMRLKPFATTESIQRVLYEMIQNKTPIVDKFSKKGYMIRIADLYLFQPIELTDPHLTMHDRMAPVSKKPLEFTLETVDVVEKKESGIMRTLLEKYERAKGEIPEKTEDDWYAVFPIAADHMMARGVSEESLEDYLIRHICEELRFEEQLELLNYLFSTSELTPLETEIKAYFERDIKQVDDLTGILLFNETEKEKTKIKTKDKEEKGDWYIFNPVMIGVDTSKVWIPAMYTDSMALNRVRTKVKDPFFKFYGFLGIFHDKYCFKVKETKDEKSRGANVEQKSKSQIIALMNSTLEESDLYTKENTKKLSVITLCVIEELLLRNLDETRKSRYFLSRTEYNLK